MVRETTVTRKMGMGWLGACAHSAVRATKNNPMAFIDSNLRGNHSNHRASVRHDTGGTGCLAVLRPFRHSRIKRSEIVNDCEPASRGRARWAGLGAFRPPGWRVVWNWLHPQHVETVLSPSRQTGRYVPHMNKPVPQMNTRIFVSPILSVP